MRLRHRHPVNRKLHEERSLGQRVADAVTTFSGSWWFLGIHAIWFGVWIVFKVESYPFGLLTMIVSLEAIGLATLVMISQKRQDRTTRALAEHDYEVNKEAFDEILAVSQRTLAIVQHLGIEAMVAPKT